VDRRERDEIMRQQVVLPQTPRERRELAALDEELRSLTLTGKPLPVRLRNYRTSAEAYLAATGGPLPYMLRLHEIELQIAEHELALEGAWRELADELAGDDRGFSRRWRATAGRWSFDEVNDLIERHNRWYPTESRLPMDPATGDFALVNGRHYRLQTLDAAWVLERFPASLDAVVSAAASEVTPHG
jgi:hypothetical protein